MASGQKDFLSVADWTADDLRALLDRAAEKSGFDYHLGRLKSGAADVVTFLNGFTASPEYVNRLAGLGCAMP